jgi:hypothetical protein
MFWFSPLQSSQIYRQQPKHIKAYFPSLQEPGAFDFFRIFNISCDLFFAQYPQNNNMVVSGLESLSPSLQSLWTHDLTADFSPSRIKWNPSDLGIFMDCYAFPLWIKVFGKLDSWGFENTFQGAWKKWS